LSAVRGGSDKVVVVVISRIERVARFGTVKPIRLGSLSNEEYVVYLFKELAFGSVNPQLARIGLDILGLLRGLLLSGDVVVADMLRRNLSVLAPYTEAVRDGGASSVRTRNFLLRKIVQWTSLGSRLLSSRSLRIMPSRGVKGGVVRRGNSVPRLGIS
jgi:hypothetical protein